MLLSFELENIRYLQIEYTQNDNIYTHKLALKEKCENFFVALLPKEEEFYCKINSEVKLSFICYDGLYLTTAEIGNIKTDDEYSIFEIRNPKALDYQQNRAFYRILAEYDCVYTIEFESEVKSFNAVTYDISASGVSIITEEKIIPTRETSIVIYLPMCTIKSYLQFVRCEAYDDNYKLSFRFIDLNQKDEDYLKKLCVMKQHSSL